MTRDDFQYLYEGQKVIVHFSENTFVADSMREWEGKVVTLLRPLSEMGNDSWLIEEDKSDGPGKCPISQPEGWHWFPWMIEPYDNVICSDQYTDEEFADFIMG